MNDAYTLMLDTGNFTSADALNGKKKTEAMLAGLALLGCNVLNLGERDFQYGRQFLLEQEQRHPFTFISSNIVDSQTDDFFVKPYVIKEYKGLKIGIFGLTAKNFPIRTPREDSALVIRDPLEAARYFVKQLGGKCDLVFALSHLGYHQSEILAKKVSGIDLIISGKHTFRHKRARKINNTILIQTTRQGQYIGDLLLEFDAEKKIVAFKDASSVLDQSIPDDSLLLQLVQKYKRQMQARPSPRLAATKQGGKRRKRLSGYYMGAGKCRECHQKEYDQWTQSKHANAYELLEVKQQQTDSNCLHCHTTGYKIANGFRNLHTTPDLAGVQCESCHGRRFHHVREQKAPKNQSKIVTAANKKKTNPVPVSLCRTCHSRERDPDFKAEEAMKKVCRNSF